MRTVTKPLLLMCLTLVFAAFSGIYQSGHADVRYAPVHDGTKTLKLAYRDSGTGSPVILLHGFGASSYTWRHVEPALVAAGHRVLTVDLKGFGLSDKPLDENYSIFDQAVLISDFIDRLGLRNVTLVGHSLGGGVALALTLHDDPQKRKRISRLILIDTVAYAQNIPIAFNILRTPVIGKLGSRLVPLDVQTRVALRLAYYDNSKFSETDVKRYADPLKDKGSRHAMIQTARQIMPENLPELSRRYKTIKIPTLIIWCDHDKVIKPHIGLRLHKDMPNSDFRVIGNCGHLPQEEQPQDTIRLLQAFLKK